uniref:FIIND domain-containing protein n=1 Tax=Astyanax mexicanus TaxID=7994 RepID=A0A3B1IDE1_ASTMX
PSSKSLLEPVNWCSLCRNLLDSKDCNYWKRIEPDLTLADGREKYRVRTTQGWYQCGVTGLRWESCCGAELEYCLEDWDQFSQFLEKKHFTPCGPLIKIRVISGDLTSVHLPHVLCSLWNYRKDVKLLHSEESGVSLEECLLLSFHVIPICKTFPAQGVVVSSRFNVKAHCDVVIYRTSAAHLTLHVYLVPCHPYMKESVEKREKESVEILRLKTCYPLQLGDRYTLATSCPSHIIPEKLKFTYINKTLNCFEVFIEDAKEGFFLHLLNKVHISEWGTIIRPGK